MSEIRPVGQGRRVGPEVVLRNLARLLRMVILPFIRLEVRGGACAAELRTGVIVANHRSMGDAAIGMVVVHLFGHYPRVLVAREFVEDRWTRVLARAVGAIPVDRERGPNGALDPAVAALEAGAPIIVMPEGRLHVDPDPDTTGPAKTGAARLAGRSGMPVVVAALSGTAEAWPPGRRLPRLNPFRRPVVLCRVADEPVYVDGDDARGDTDTIMAELRRHLRVANGERAEVVTRLTRG